ncbi:voltage-gated potassium channel subunit beta-2-like [Brevipalpus obovatus]|uniref:voltage-gated potassium channel subunit beta-2-like n=1 Tax=Brevipalpus obovatus TaxID=246614 RepID=UPI003D9E0B6E
MNREDSVRRHSSTRELGPSDLALMSIEQHSPAYSATPSTPRYEMFSNCTFGPSIYGQMKYKNLGKSGLKVPLIAMGAWNAFGGRLSEHVAEELITTAYENGVNYFDTGDAFVNGRCEVLLGSIIKKRGWLRNTFIISTKLFWNTGPSYTGPNSSLSRKMLIESLESSLRRLQLRYVDIVIINKLDNMCPMEEIVRAMAYIIDRGLALYWGTSRWSPTHIMEAFSIARQFNCPPPTCEQMEYHMFNRDKMEIYMPELHHKLGIGSMIWSPFSMNSDDGIGLISRTSLKVEQKFSSKITELNPIFSKLSCDISQFTIAWILKNENVDCVFISPRNLDQLYLLLNSLKLLPKLNSASLDEVERILDNRPSVRKANPGQNSRGDVPNNGSGPEAISSKPREMTIHL